MQLCWQTRGPQRQYSIRRKYIFQCGTCLRTAIDLVGPDCPPLHVQSSPDSSRLFSMFTTTESGATASAQRRRRRSDHLRQCLICNESTELAQWPSDTTRQLFRPGSIPPVQRKYLQNFCLCLYLHVGPNCHLRTPRPTLAKTSSLVFSVFRTLDIVWAFWK